MKTYSPTDAQLEFPKVLQWLKSAPVTIQDKEENIAVILDYKDYIDMVDLTNYDRDENSHRLDFEEYL